jgi:signal transduction histidine kinase
MKIGTKLTVSIAVPVVVLLALFGYLDDRRSRAWHRAELAREGRAIARTVQLAMEDYFSTGQVDQAHEFIDRITSYERVLGLRLFAADGRALYQSASLDSFPFSHEEELRRALLTRTSNSWRRQVGEEWALAFLLPLTGPTGELLGAVQVLQLESYIEQDARASRTSIFLLTLITVLSIAVIVLAVTNHVVGRPVERLVRGFRDVGAGDLQTRVEARGNDELQRLSHEFDAMLERLEDARQSLLSEQKARAEVEARVAQAEHLASVGTLTAGLAHQIGTPLNVIRGRAERLLRRMEVVSEPRNATVERDLSIIAEQVDRIALLVRRMLDFARAREMRKEQGDILAILRDVLELLEVRFEQHGIRALLPVGSFISHIRVDSDQLREVFLNIFTNAADAMPSGGTITIEIDPVERPSPGDPLNVRPMIRIRVRDDGVGIAQENLSRVFDPFFTTKEVGRGTGLGLSVAYGIVREHGGWLEVESNPERGSCLTVTLPIGNDRISREAEAFAMENGEAVVSWRAARETEAKGEVGMEQERTS